MTKHPRQKAKHLAAAWLVGMILLPAVAVTEDSIKLGGATLPLLVNEDFDDGADRWEPTDPQAWKVATVDGRQVFSQFTASNYKPPHRSPFNFALLKSQQVSDFVFDARLRSTKPDYNHRDMCLVFGYQNPGHFYYVHLGKKTDDHANQIFIVNDAPRVKISTRTSDGTNWDDNWHQVRVTRQVASGEIKIYFDDLEKPVMEATDKTFTWGQIGIGSFDDTGDWDWVRLYGMRAPDTGTTILNK